MTTGEDARLIRKTNDDTPEVWPEVDEDEIRVPIEQVKILDYRPDGGKEYSEESWLVQVGDVITFWYEFWMAGGSSGDATYNEAYTETIEVPDIILTGTFPVLHYNPETKAWDSADTVPEVELMDELATITRKAADAYLALHDDRVKPVTEAIKGELFPFTYSP